MIPDWVFFGLGASAASAGVLLVQEWLKASGFAVAFWNKVTCILIMVPFVIYAGLPDNPLFYLILAGQSVLWMISDVVFFTGVPVVGAGVVSRILPVSVILTFILWFVIEPELLQTYMQTPMKFAAIFGILCLSTYFAIRMKRCPITWKGVRAVWFVLFASVAGTLAAKVVTQQTDIERGPFAYVFVEALLMVTAWSVYYLIRRPVPWDIFKSAHSIKAGFLVGCCSSVMVVLNISALFSADNPAYLAAVKFLDAVIILWVYRLTKRKDDSDIAAGLGVVACAAALVILKSL